MTIGEAFLAMEMKGLRGKVARKDWPEDQYLTESNRRALFFADGLFLVSTEDKFADDWEVRE